LFYGIFCNVCLAYLINYLLTYYIVGDYQIDVCYFGQSVPSSPFCAKVWDASKVVVAPIASARVCVQSTFCSMFISVQHSKYSFNNGPPTVPLLRVCNPAYSEPIPKPGNREVCSRRVSGVNYFGLHVWAYSCCYLCGCSRPASGHERRQWEGTSD